MQGVGLDLAIQRGEVFAQLVAEYDGVIQAFSLSRLAFPCRLARHLPGVPVTASSAYPHAFSGPKRERPGFVEFRWLRL